MLSKQMLSVYLFFEQSSIQNENQSGDYQKKKKKFCVFACCRITSEVKNCYLKCNCIELYFKQNVDTKEVIPQQSITTTSSLFHFYRGNPVKNLIYFLQQHTYLDTNIGFYILYIYTT